MAQFNILVVGRDHDERPAQRGIALPSEVREKIYTKNASRFIGRDRSVRLNLPRAQATLEQHVHAIQRTEQENTPEWVLREWN